MILAGMRFSSLVADENHFMQMHKLPIIPFTVKNETLGWNASVCLIRQPTRADELRDARPADA
jgi:hypothetical protein